MNVYGRICACFRKQHTFAANFFTAALFNGRKVDVFEPYIEKNPPQDVWADVKDPKFTGVEEVHGRWHFVERLFPKITIPEPPKTPSSTGWRPPAETVPDLPYFIRRSRNHMLPVYEGRAYKECVLVTSIRNIGGDIWVFENDLKKYLQGKLNTEVKSHVNEIGCFVNVGGEHIEIIKEWLYDLGF